MNLCVGLNGPKSKSGFRLITEPKAKVPKETLAFGVAEISNCHQRN